MLRDAEFNESGYQLLSYSPAMSVFQEEWNEVVDGKRHFPSLERDFTENHGREKVMY